MIRAVLEEGALFLLPFAAFAAILLLRRRNVLVIEHWSGRSAWLALAGLAVVLAGFLWRGLAPRPAGGFQPTHMENGQVVPGRFQ